MPEDASFVARHELDQLLYLLDVRKEVHGVLIIGGPGVGKTVLLRMAEERLRRRGQRVICVAVRDLPPRVNLANHLIDLAAPWGIRGITRPTVLSSAGSSSLKGAIPYLREATARMPRPVVMFDGLDEAEHPSRLASAIAELSIGLDNWKFVVSSRAEAVRSLGQFSRFEILNLREFNTEEATRLLQMTAPGLSRNEVDELVGMSGNSPLLIRLLGQAAQQTAPPVDGQRRSLRDELRRLIRNSIRTSPDPESFRQLLEEIALAGGREQVSTLAAKVNLPEDEVSRILLDGELQRVLILENSGTVGLAHRLIADVILQDLLLKSPFRLADLAFGAEEAERDELLIDSFVGRWNVSEILRQRKSIVVGDRGSGKSAIYRVLALDHPTDAVDSTPGSIRLYPIANSDDMLRRIVAKDAWLDADALRAAWLVVIASIVASSVTESETASKRLRRDANNLRAVLGLPTQPVPLLWRAVRAVARPLLGTNLKFSVGPINLEAQLPDGNAVSLAKPAIDIELYLDELNGFLRQEDQRVVVMLDRIDEIFKYDRARQEAVVQALLQAENRLSMHSNLSLLIFLRTDLFELYDIQEKNKLVSRTLTLDWSEEDWLEVLVRRILANKSLDQVARDLGASGPALDVNSTLRILFPPDVEGQPIDRWLIESLRNGNGDISPRAAILLLYLAREKSVHADRLVDELPVFSAEAVTTAMTALSQLSFSEVINDFKVAPTFVQNCRAAKLDRFTLDEVQQLFNEDEGTRSEQIRLLERLGFLERTVLSGSDGPKSEFRVPPLYTRCWENSQ